MSLPDWFMARVQVDESGCWIWTGARTSNGYGAFDRGGKGQRAHRFAFTSVHGAIPESHDIHHDCEIRLCVNPDHLRALTHREHAYLHGFGGSEPATHCKYGHPYDESNTYVWKDKRQCRACNTARHKERYKPSPRRTPGYCKYGHELTPENVYRSPRGKYGGCLVCRRRRTREWYWKRGRELRRSRRTGPVAAEPVLAEGPRPAVNQGGTPSAGSDPTP